MNTKRFISFSTILLTTVSSVFSQCIIAGTDFDTDTELCCPILNSDAEEGGWYEEDLDVTGLCSSDMFASFENVKQKGVGGIFSTESSNEMTKVDKVFHLGTQIQYGDGQYGYSTVTAQPKLIHPFFKANEKSNNMFVNIGSANNCQFLTYTVYGLTPGTSVELSFTLYNLLDPEYFDYLVTNVCKGTGTKVPQLQDFITKYGYSNTGTIIGNPLKLGVISTDQNITYNIGYNNSIELGGIPALKYTTATASYGKSTVVTHKATVPASGSISFLFFRTEDCFQIPVGIDDIKVTGEVSPIIVSSKGTPCPMQPLNLTSRHNYPEGTKFSWKESVTNQTSSDASFKFIPDAAKTDYSVTLEVTLPGCKASKSEAFNLHSGTCCTSADGVPMAMSYLFYDDFGNFISDDLYEWTDRFGVTHTVKIPAGQVHDAMSLTGSSTIPYVRAYNIEASGATLAVPALADHPNSPDCSGPATQLYCHGVYAVSKAGGYPDGVQYDNSGTKTGGMLQFDLLDDGTQDDFFEIDIDHICTGKEISFGADFASISEHPGCIEVSLEYNGNVLASEYESFNGGSDGWKSINKEFAIRSEDVNGKSEVTLTMKMKHNKSCGLIGETRDYAIDNIFFSVCTPPDVDLQYSISKGDLLELSTGDVFTLSAVTSDAVTRFYLYSDGQIDPSKKLGYVYQYTFQDPSTENEINKIGWKTIHKEEVVEMASFDVDIEKYWNDIFSKMEANDRIYFRVVIGEYSDLIADQSWNKHSALSPCRKVSISNIPVVAGINYVPPTTKTYLYYDDFGNFVSDSTYEWTDKDGVTHTEKIPTGQVHEAQSLTGAPKIPYVRAYNIEASGAKLEVPALADHPYSVNCNGPANELYCRGVYAVSKSSGYPDGVQYDNSGSKTGGMLQFDLLDDGSQDEFFNVDFDHICTGKEVYFGVDFASISYHPGSIEVKLECNGKTLVSKTASVSGGSDGWKTVTGNYTINAEDVDGADKATITMKISNTLTTTTGGGRNYAIDNIYFAVDSLDCPTTCKDIKNTVDNAKTIAYKKADAKGGSLKPLDQQSGSTFKSALSIKGHTLMVGLVEGATDATAPDLATAKFGAASPIIPTPTVKDVDSSDDEYLWYYTYMESAEGCLSDTVLVGVVIKGAPSPTPKDAAYCVNSGDVKPMSEYATPASEDPAGELVFYGPDKTTKMDPSDLPNVSMPGGYTYYVSQISSTGGGESTKQPIVIEVYGVNDVDLSEASHKYCKGADATPLENIASEKPSGDDYIKSSGWEFFEGNEPSLNEKTAGAETSMKVNTSTTGVFKYYARLKYEVPNSSEVCYGNHVAYRVEIQSVDDPITGTVTYLKAEGENGGFKKPTEQNPDAIIGDASCTDCSIVWFDVNKNEIDESDATPKYDASLIGSVSYTYYVKQINALGCESLFKPVTIIVEATPTSLKDTPAKAVSIAPNPASTKISVIAEEAVEKVEILNMVGEVVKVSNNKDIDTSNLSNGVYFVRTTVNDETTVHKLVINK